MLIRKGGTYTATNSDLFIKVYTVHDNSVRTGKITIEAEVFYKSNNNLCSWLTPFGPKNLILIWDVVKHWERYVPKVDK